ncbi:MAG: DoxX family membrane protein [Patescibacteria group bacterium]
MLNPIPELLVLSFFAPTIIRVFLGGAFLYRGLRALGKEKGMLAEQIQKVPFFFGSPLAWITFIGSLEIITALLLIVGLYTQIAAIIIALFSIANLKMRIFGKVIGNEAALFYVMTLAASLSLALTGAGLFAFDLPL